MLKRIKFYKLKKEKLYYYRIYLVQREVYIMAKCDTCGRECEGSPSGYRDMCEDCYNDYLKDRN